MHTEGVSFFLFGGCVTWGKLLECERGQKTLHIHELPNTGVMCAVREHVLAFADSWLFMRVGLPSCAHDQFMKDAITLG